MSLLQLIENTKLQQSDKSDAGHNDTGKKTKVIDANFSMLRNAINSDNGSITGSDVSDYLERAAELNDEVETVPYGLETDDGKIVKIYVALTDAEAVEETLKTLLGVEDDIEEVVNQLSQKYDIVDVVWPKEDAPDEDADDIAIDADIETFMAASSASTDDEDEDEEFETVASTDGEDKSSVEDEPTIDSKESETNMNAITVKIPEGVDITDEELEEFITSSEILEGFTFERLDTGEVKFMSPEKIEDEAKGEIISLIKDFLSSKSENSADAKGADMEKDKTKNESVSLLKSIIAETTDGVNDRFDIQVDSQTKTLINKLRRPYERKLVQVFSMVGIPGRFLNTQDVEAGVQAAADKLRKQVSIRRDFDKFFDALSTAKGFTKVEEPKVEEAVFTTYTQKLLGHVLTDLGLPVALIDKSGPSVVTVGLYRTAKLIEDTTELEETLRRLAIRMGIKVTDKFDESVESVENMTFAQTVDFIYEGITSGRIAKSEFAKLVKKTSLK